MITVHADPKSRPAISQPADDQTRRGIPVVSCVAAAVMPGHYAKERWILPWAPVTPPRTGAGPWIRPPRATVEPCRVKHHAPSGSRPPSAAPCSCASRALAAGLAGLTFLAAPAAGGETGRDPSTEAHQDGCRRCKGRGVKDCPEHDATDRDFEGRVLFCSVAAGCEDCGGTMVIDCDRCDGGPESAAAEARRAAIAEWMERSEVAKTSSATSRAVRPITSSSSSTSRASSRSAARRSTATA